jgi:hypothetical protein
MTATGYKMKTATDGLKTTPNWLRRAKMTRRADLTIEKNKYGGYEITAIVNGYLMTRQFFYYTKREAARLFLLEANS